MLAFFIGFVMPDPRGVLFGSLASVPLSLFALWVKTDGQTVALETPAHVAAAGYVLVLILAADWVVFIVCAYLAYGLKRAFIQKRTT